MFWMLKRMVNWYILVTKGLVLVLFEFEKLRVNTYVMHNHSKLKMRGGEKNETLSGNLKHKHTIYYFMRKFHVLENCVAIEAPLI